MNKACKKCRREGAKLMLKGERCLTPKCAFSRRSYVPGMHGPNQRTKLSEYGRQLREKQKSKAIYGISESTLSKYYRLSDKKEGNTTENLIIMLETRLDNVIFRAGYADSRSKAKQIISHGFVIVNGVKTNISSYILKNTDKISFNKKYKIENKKRDFPGWLKIDKKNNQIKILNLPKREEVDLSINENLVSEFYSR